MRYLIIIEATETGFSAYAPDLPGCIAAAETKDEVQRDMADAMAFHWEGLRKERMVIPEPRSSSLYVDVPE